MTSCSAIPADDPNRQLTVADPDAAGIPHVSVAGGTYTILVSGADTAGRYCLIDMLVPKGGGPPPASARFRGDVHASGGRARVQLPWPDADRPRRIDRQYSSQCSPRVQEYVGQDGPHATAGQEELFLVISFPVESRTAPPPKVSAEAQAEKGKLLATLAPKYRTEILAR
jgi:hypothetical protein